MIEPGQKTTVEYGGWRVSIEHLDVMTGNVSDLMDLIRSAFCSHFGSEMEKKWFEDTTS